MIRNILHVKQSLVIIQKGSRVLMDRAFGSRTVSIKDGLSLITITSQGIWDTPGAVSYFSGLFYESGINIEEFISCYTDTLLVLKHSDTRKAYEILSAIMG